MGKRAFWLVERPCRGRGMVFGPESLRTKRHEFIKINLIKLIVQGIITPNTNKILIDLIDIQRY